jgi:hypothetical protein
VTRLSKSRILSALQCPKRAHLEVHRRELAKYTPRMEAAFATGHQVGHLAMDLYGPGVLIDYPREQLDRALAETGERLAGPYRETIFEATLEHDGVLVREDVLLPVNVNGRESWQVVEVKSSTTLKEVYTHDCAVQAWVHRNAGYPLDSISLAHVNNQFEYAGDGNFDGLLVEHDLTAQAWPLLEAVPMWIDQARAAIEGPEPRVAVGQRCTKPYSCPFMDHCWPSRDNGVAYPVPGLGGQKQKLGELVAEGYRDLRDVPAAQLSTDKQRRIRQVTRDGRPEVLPGAREFVNSLDYPRFYLDFEAVGVPLPFWSGIRPYQQVPFQWSCHIERGPGQAAELEHTEFLDLSGDNPSRPLALALIDTLEDNGPVLMYTPYERQIVHFLAGQLPDLAPALHAIAQRLVDLAPVTERNYYHPDMLGSWSIKAVLPTIAPDLDYSDLVGVKEGTGAVDAYLEAIDPDTGERRRAALREQLLVYCRYDTEAMVRLARFFAESV